MNLKFALLFFFGICLVNTEATAQQEINQTDANGLRQGPWQKKFAGTNQLRYEGQFKDGKEVGLFKFYCEDCKSQPMVTKAFSGDTAAVKYYTVKGKLVSEGTMQGKKRIGEWVYYQEKSKAVMTRETYTNGELDGMKTTYYPHGQIAEELHYKNGLKQGANNYYAPNGVLLKKLTYVDDKLEGIGTYNDSNGTVEIEGNYRKGRKHGLWKYYKNGKLIKEETYPKPRKKGN